MVQSRAEVAEAGCDHPRGENVEMTVQEYLKADRQWPHRLRVSFAEMRLKQSASPEAREFWSAVLDANDKTMRR